MAKIRLQCITCKRSDISYEEQVEQACRGGADAVLFGDKTLSAREVLEVGARLKDICLQHKAVFLINDRPDLALALDADGLHLGPDDIPMSWARQILGGRKIIGCSVSTLGQALAAAKEGAQYLAVGPIFASSEKTKKDERGVDIIRLVKERVKIPVIARGGINLDNAAEAVAAGADGIASVRGICGARLISQSAAELKEKVMKALEARAAADTNDTY